MKNILFIIADDLGRNLGCYGDTSIRTPHIDSLADEGVVFENAFASTASCSGSRSTLYTGLHTHQNGQYGLGHSFHHFATLDNVETLPELFNASGYLTGIVGKVHVGPASVYPWVERRESPTRDVQWVAGQAREVFDRSTKEGRPFHLTVGFMDPHRDNTRAGFANDREYPGVKDTLYDPAQVEVPEFLNDLPEVRAEIAEYYRSISRMDQGVGMILSHLRQSGLYDNTMIVFTSDNGSPFVNSKTTLFDSGVRLPLIVRIPGGPVGTNPNMISYIDLLPTFLDFADAHPPRLKEDPPARRGRSFLPVLAEKSLNPDWTEVYGSHTFHELTNYYPTRYVRTQTYKYHRNVLHKLDFPFGADLYASKCWEAIRKAPQVEKEGKREIMIGRRSLSSYLQRGPEELFDLQADPHEVVNVVKDPQYAEVLLELSGKVEVWQKETEDPWFFRDGVSVRSMAQYVGEDGWRLPERMDFQGEL